MADTSLTYLGSDGESAFSVSIPGPSDGSKPVVGFPQMGPMLEFIEYFWPMWENAGTNLADTGIGLSASVTGTHLTWGAASHGVGLVGSVGFVAGVDDVIVPQIVVYKGYSLERLFSLDSGATWIHEVIVNDPDHNTRILYRNGVVENLLAYDASDFPITSLLARWGNYDLAVATVDLEFVRIWNRALTAYEVDDLYGNPYLMFGVSAQVLDEILTIIEFMKPMGTEFTF